MEVIFKIADESKIASVVKLCNECFDENTSVETALKIFNENKSKNNIYLIGECDGVVIAHTRIAIVPTIFEDMEIFAILNHVCVKPEFRKHKIATKMLDIVVKICKERNCGSIKLWSKNFRVPAHKCYQKYGFEKIDAAFFEMNIKEEK